MNAKRSFFAYLKKCFLKTAIASAVFFVFFFPLISHAAPTKGYEALQVVGGGTITLSPGQEKTIMVGFQNKGEKSWFKEGASFISIYTQNPKYRTSLFQTSSWLAVDQPARLNEIEVPVGSVGHILLPLKAPQSTGTYKETFQLAAEDTAWIPGGTFTLTIIVTNNVTNSKKNTDTSSTTTEETKTNDASGYEAMILLKSAKKIKANAGETISFTVGMKNMRTILVNKNSVLVIFVISISTDMISLFNN